MRNKIVPGLLAAVCTLAWADGPALRPDQTAYLDLYKEFVETNTTVTTGSCTELAGKIAGHLKSAGFEDKDITLFSVPDHPKEGGIVAILQGSSKSAKPMLLLGHLDVVEAKRADWSVPLEARRLRLEKPLVRRTRLEAREAALVGAALAGVVRCGIAHAAAESQPWFGMGQALVWEGQGEPAHAAEEPRP